MLTERTEKFPDAVIQGRIKFFNVNRGFGFVRGHDGYDYYVSESRLSGDRLPDRNEKCTVFGYIARFENGKERRAATKCEIATHESF